MKNKDGKKMVSAELITKAKKAFSLTDEKAFDKMITNGHTLENALQMTAKDYFAGADITKWVKENQ